MNRAIVFLSFVSLALLAACANLVVPFTIAPTVGAVTLPLGGDVAVTVEVDRSDGFSEAVVVTVTGLPNGVTASALTIAGNEDSGELTLSATAGAQTGLTTLTIVGTAGDDEATAELELTVAEPAATLIMTLASDSASVPLGGDVAVTIEVDRSGGFSEAVVVTVTGLPSGVTASALTIGGAEDSGVLTLSATAGAQIGPATLTIVGTADSDEATAEFDLTVTDPNQLSVSVAATGLTIPWDIAFAPDGSLLITERGGTFKRLQGGVLSTITFNPAPNFASGGEAGLMGLALDPGFAGNGYLYLCYSYDDGGTLNRISRFTLQGDALIAELPLLSDIPGASIHDGCRLAIGPDQKLYATMGDAADANAAQDQNSLSGKIFRLELDGGIPGDNPFAGSPVWTLGHRNPQGLAFHPGNDRLYSTEHGPASDDEINLIEKGNNYGWPTVMGTTVQDPFTPALLAYTPTLAVAGMDFYTGTLFPWENDILFVSLKAGQLRRLELAPDGTIAADHIVLDNDYGRLRDVAVAPDGSIYLATSNQDGRANAPFPHPDDDRILVLEPAP